MLDWQHHCANRLSQPCPARRHTCRSGGLLRQLPGHPWLQRLPVVQHHRRHVSSPLCRQQCLVFAADFHGCSEPVLLLLLPFQLQL